MRNESALIPKIGKAMKRASPTILSCFGAMGVVATAVLAAKATPKARDLIHANSRKNHDGDPYAATKTEAVKACWKCYIPAAATGTATIICILGANTLNRRQQATLTSAYALLSRQYDDYRRKLKELYGEEAHQRIMESLAVEQARNNTISVQGVFGDDGSCLEFGDANEEQRLFYDSISQRYFQSTISKVLQAEYHLNRNMVLGFGFVSINDFYDFLGIDQIPEGDTLGWFICDGFMWIDFNHSKAMVDDGLNGEVECFIVDAVFPPMPEKSWDI